MGDKWVGNLINILFNKKEWERDVDGKVTSEKLFSELGYVDPNFHVVLNSAF